MGRLLLASFAAGQTRERGQVRSSLRSLLGLQLISESKLGGFLLKLGKFVLILGHLLEGGLDELALHVTDGDGELVDLEITEDDLTLEEEHFSFKGVPFVEVLLEIFLSSSVEALSRSALVPQRSAMTRRRSSAFRSCSFFSSSAAFLRSKVRSFFLRSGVMNPFFLAILMC